MIITDLTIILVIIAAILYGLISGYREIEILVSRGSYYWVNFKKNLYWFTNQTGPNKDKDSFHISNGIAVTIISLAFSFILYLILDLSWYWILINTVLFWFWIFYVRNVAMHVLIPKWQRDNFQLKLWYLAPIIGNYLNKKLGK